MSSKKQSNYEIELDLIGIIKLVWSKKQIIVSIVAIAIASIFILEKTKENKIDVYLGTTKIMPISTFEELEYSNFNYFNEIYLSTKALYIQNISEIKFNKLESVKTFSSIRKDFLLNLFVEKFNEISFLKKVVEKTNLIDKKKYQDKKKYEKAVLNKAFSINLLPPDDPNKVKNNNLYWRIQFNTNQLPDWEKFLQNAIIMANQDIRKHLKESFDYAIKNEKELKTKLIEDFNFQLEDAIKYQETIYKRRIAYLKEQSKIAREKNIAKDYLSQLDIQFNMIEGVANLKNIPNYLPYYMRGYEAIETEIEIISFRRDQKLFADGVIELEQKLRKINSNSDISKLELLFKSTPISSSKNFVAANIIPSSTEFINISNYNKSNLQIKLLFAAIFALMVSIFIIIMVDLVKKHK